ncbi:MULTISPECIES: Tim44 domain-containing protein [Halomonadaceae]|jgi:predicted lipid-binding transport protein (Tim44 family)|uniref:Tim44 domain-containing protein n=1 Tax=Billgrantia aerodenitrificans TaxID=2733483 RepID=A0ABS9ALC1_9GAMM|nr:MULTISPECIES: Tim44-like domain-containing protein [Halomonas]MCE8022521.1 Tim44 domain-containing protein [Halomonas aerodenitrificans]MCE8038078.1 Tim44 domain-containing protein [Halomonas sp. MCCC 1A11062]
MRHFLVMLMVAVMGFGLAVEHAEARRMGGGGNVGSFSRSADRPAAAPNQAAPARQAQPSQAAGSRMPGMLGGMLAGGLLAALFFGGAFDELRLMDILLIAGLGFLLFRLLARRRTAVAGGPQPADNQPHAAPQAFQPAPGATMGGAFDSLPEWFDRERFLSGAKEHFMTLQRAWDNNDFSGIQEYVTPELYNLLREERSKHPANNRTETVRLFAELGDVREIGKQAEATVIFHGILDENGEQTEFNETWHLVREMRDGAPWYLQGIEQNS